MNFASQLMEATQDFTENVNDPRASMFLTAQVVLRGLDQYIYLWLFYNGEEPPEGVFDKFLAIPYTDDDIGTQSYSNLVCDIA